jgi:mono/diheme cytochrome c family protein
MRQSDLRGIVLACWAQVAVGCSYNAPDPMAKEERYNAFGTSDFFDNGAAMRPLEPGTVPVEHTTFSDDITVGRSDGGALDEVPFAISLSEIRAGRARFERICGACHGLLGDGESVVGRRMPLRRPPSLIAWPPIPASHVHDVIVQGFGLMPSYADVLDSRAIWTVAAYVRVLARSQHVDAAELPPTERQRLEGANP